MNIFADDLEYGDIDFTVYYNEDGEAELLEEMEVVLIAVIVGLL